RVYQDRLKLYSTPERRHIEQVSFANAADAKRASERINAGLAFDDLAKEPEIADKLVDLGTITKADIIDPAVANAAFDLAEGAVSGPVTGRFGTVMVRVLKIDPPATKPFAEVESDLKRDMAADRAKADVNKIRDKIDEELGGGAQIEEIAKKLNLKMLTIEAVDRGGRAPEGKQGAGPPARVDGVKNAFYFQIGTGEDPPPLPSRGVGWVALGQLTPPP